MQDNLLQAQRQFQLWRANKQSGESVPSELWCLVNQLFESNQYKPYVIGKCLGLSTAQLKRRFPTRFPTKPSKAPVASTQPVSSPNIRNPDAAAVTSSEQSTFVEAHVDMTSLIAHSHSSTSEYARSLLPTLTLQRTNGTQLTLANPTSDILTKVLNHFITE